MRIYSQSEHRFDNFFEYRSQRVLNRVWERGGGEDCPLTRIRGSSPRGRAFVFRIAAFFMPRPQGEVAPQAAERGGGGKHTPYVSLFTLQFSLFTFHLEKRFEPSLAHRERWRRRRRRGRGGGKHTPERANFLLHPHPSLRDTFPCLGEGLGVAERDLAAVASTRTKVQFFVASSSVTS